AGLLGLPFGFAHHFDMGGTLQAATLYRDSFRPSEALAEPYLIVTANVLTADTAEEADWHANPGRLTMLGRRTGRFTPLPSPQAASEHPDLAEALRLPSNRIVGAPDQVVSEMHELADRTGASELMITSVAYDIDARVRSLELVAEHWS